MSKELEALRQLHMAGAYVSESLRNKITPSKATELKNVLYQAIKRNEPMKPLKVNNTKLIYWCSKCDCSSIQRYDKFCHECGQNLDWSDEE